LAEGEPRAPLKESQKLLALDITFDDSDGANNANSYKASMMNPIIQDFNPMGMHEHFGPPSQTQTKTHLGLASCNLLKDYVNNYPCLREVAILIKKFLAV